jgi:putative hydrolase of the HAD superfamily
MADVVLFDLFGVIARTQTPAAVDALAAVARVPVPAFVDAYWRHRVPYDRGQVTAAGYWHAVADELGTGFGADRVAALVAADVASWSAVDDAMVALVERAGARLGLLSNIPEDLAVHYERHHDRWLRRFEVVAFSCRLGVAKPDPEAFLWCCDLLGVNPDRILFIDDRAENTQAAGRLGMRTHRFTGPRAAARAIDSQLRRKSA